MNPQFESRIYKAKAVLCMVLIFYTPMWLFGCGQTSNLDVLPADAFAGTPITAEHPLSRALEFSRFQDATDIEMNAAEQSFSLVFPESDESRSVGGHYTIEEGQFVITQLRLEADGAWIEMTLNSAKQITYIQTSTGEEWTREKEDAAHVIVSEGQSSSGTSSSPSVGGQTPGAVFQEMTTASAGVQAYAEANSDLLAIAQYCDKEAGLDTGSRTKQDSAAFFLPAVLVLTALASVWGITGLAASLMGVFSLTNLLQNRAAANRFNGTWNVAPAQGANAVVAGAVTAPTIIVVEDGRIADLRSTLQLWTILESQLVSAVATNVQWRVLAEVELTPLPTRTVATVEAIFDVNEITGSPVFLLQGNLEMNVDTIVSSQGPIEIY